MEKQKKQQLTEKIHLIKTSTTKTNSIFIKQIGTHIEKKKFPENLQFKKYLVVDVLTCLIMKTLL